MLKKIMLILGLGILLSSDMQCAGKEIVAVLAAGAVTSSYMYMQYREKNSHVVEKINRFWKHITENIRPAEFSQMVSLFKEFDIFIFDLNEQVNYRYSSWTAPWNWTSDMKQAYIKAKLLNVMFKYIDVISLWHNQISDAAMLQLAQTVLFGDGIMTKFIDQLAVDIKMIESLSNELQSGFGTMLKNHLVAIQNMAKNSGVYAQERLLFV